MKFTLTATDGKARAGLVQTDHGVIETPIFMPVGTQGTVKAMEPRELAEAGAQIILGNTYHLYLRPGTETIRKAGGLHRFAAWDRPMLTDSGGYQVFSLTDLRRIEEEGVTFRSHLDGSSHLFTPESVVRIQRDLGSDIMMVLDECPPHPCDVEYAQTSHELTVRWAARCQEAMGCEPERYGHRQSLFAIVQGSTFPTIREASAKALVSMDFEGYAIGGLAVGEPAETMYEITAFTEQFLPKEKPRYLMGVGTPENIIESIARGVDMFDCVMPTRNGRNANLFTWNGTLNLRNAQYKQDFSPVDESCDCYGCRTFTRAYLRHLFLSREILALQLATIHNVTFYLRMVREARRAICEGQFDSWKQTFLAGIHADAPVAGTE